MSLRQANEVLLNNYIDKDFVSALLPLNLLTCLFLQPKYSTLYGFVTPNGHSTILLSVIFLIPATTVSYIRFSLGMKVFPVKYPNDLFMLLLPPFDLVYYILGFTTKAYFTFTQSSNLVALIINIQNSHRLFRFVKDKSFTRLKLYTWKIFASFAGFIVIFAICFVAFNLDFTIHVYFFFAMMCFDVNVLYAVGFIRVLRFALDLWISELEELSSAQVGKLDDKVAYHKLMLQAFADIISAYSFYKKVFQFTILFHTMEVFVHSIIPVQTLINFAKAAGWNGIWDSVTISLFRNVSILIIKNFILLAVIGIECQNFYSSVYEADATCLSLLKKNLVDDNLQMLCKNVIRGRVAWFSPLVACGVCSVDASLLTRMLQLVTVYIVVLLQFAFL